jgi:hypothetical protein
LAVNECKWHWVGHIIMALGILVTWLMTSQSNEINRERLLMDQSGWLEPGSEFRLADRPPTGECVVDSEIPGEYLGEMYPVVGVRSNRLAELVFSLRNTSAQPVRVMLLSTGEFRSDSELIWDSFLRNPKDMNIAFSAPGGQADRTVGPHDSVLVTVPVPQDRADSAGYSEIHLLAICESQPFRHLSITYLWVETVNSYRTPQGVRYKYIGGSRYVSDPITLRAKLLNHNVRVLRRDEEARFWTSWREISDDDSLNTLYRLNRFGHFN